MALWPSFVCAGGLLLLIGSQTASTTIPNTLTLENHFLSLQHPKGSAILELGLTLPPDAEGIPCGEGDTCFDYGVAKLVVVADQHCRKVSWTSSNLTELKDCVHLTGHWYGGGEQFTQPWPIEKNPRQDAPFVTADMLQERSLWYGGVTEAYWVSSQGVAVRVEESTPLFVSVPDTDGDSVADLLCLSSRQEPPYATTKAGPLSLTYYLCTGDNVRQVHETSFAKFFSLPEGVVDNRMVKDPVWSTWAQYFTLVDEKRVRAYAASITANGFNNSQVEIDDNWETCYGEAVFNLNKFPDPKQLIDDLHADGFRVTAWTHPFINSNCPSFQLADNMGYFVKDSDGVTQLTSWWQGRKAGIIDFTNPEAAQWYSQRLRDLQAQTGVDSFKFDAGESSWLPTNYTLVVDPQFWPNAYTLKYVETVAAFGGMAEVRVGRGSQRHPIFFRMLDKDSNWSIENGLKTLIPSMLHFGLLGYPFVLPDMVGGNGYTGRPDAELFTRWAQANTFMPAIQFSILPWNYDQQTTYRSRIVTSLHAEWSDYILTQLVTATTTVGPAMRPTWWLCPETEECLTADQQFLVGDDLLVTPVVEQGASTLRVVVPPGNWTRADTGEVFSGPSILTIIDITLDSVIYFTRNTAE